MVQFLIFLLQLEKPCVITLNLPIDGQELLFSLGKTTVGTSRVRLVGYFSSSGSFPDFSQTFLNRISSCHIIRK